MDDLKKVKLKKSIIFVFLSVGLSVIGIFSLSTRDYFSINLFAAETKHVEKNSVPKEIEQAVSSQFYGAKSWPSEITIDQSTHKIEYTFDEKLEEYIKKMLKSYRSDYSTVVVTDNESGEVLAAVGHQGKSNSFDTSLVLSATHPSASLIKIITAAELIQNTEVRKDTVFNFKGKSTTLFKYQLKENNNNRWTRAQDFETAFAKSNNVIFGKAAIQKMNSEKLVSMAENFGYNQSLITEFPFLVSHIGLAGDDYKLAELASGYNDETIISPIHAAAMSSIIANDGVLKNPKVISKIIEKKNGNVVWENTNIEKRVLNLKAAKEMRDMMGLTIDGGTARKSFKRMNTGYKNAIEIGGKTGSITGGKPFGKRDWFTAFAIPRDADRGKGISISVMNVNVKRWHVKSTMLAKNIIEYYYNNINPLPVTMVKMPRYISRKKPTRKYKRAIASQSKKKKTINRRVISKKETGKKNERKSKSRI